MEQEVQSTSSYTSNEVGLLGVGSGRAGKALRQWRLQWSNLLLLKSWDTWQVFCARVQKCSIFVMLSCFSSFGLYDYTSRSGLISKASISNYRIYFKISLSPQKSNNISFPPRSQQDSLQIHTYSQKLQKTQKVHGQQKVGIQCSVLHSLSTTIKLAQYRWDLVRWDLFIHFTVCCKTSRLGPSASLIMKPREKQ